MNVKLQIPRILQKYAAGDTEFSIQAKTVGEVLSEMKREHPTVYCCICDETDTVRKHINLFINNDLVADGLQTKVKSGDVVSVFQSVSGG